MKKHLSIRFLCALLAAMLLILSAMPALAQGNTYMYIRTGNTGRLHLRALPTTASESLGLYSNGTAVLVESVTGNWAYVSVNGRHGYMSLNFLTSAAPSSPAQPAPAQTESTVLYVRTGNTGRLHLREYASTTSRSLGLFSNGTAVVVTARSGDWAYVMVNGKQGYMMLNFLAAAPSQPIPTLQPVAPISGTPVIKYVSTGNSGKLHLRDYPSQTANSLGLYPNGTQVYAVDMGNGWSQVVVNGRAGYMMTQFLVYYAPIGYTPAPTLAPALTPTQIPPSSGITLYVQTGNSGGLYLRESMSTSSAALGLFPNGTRVSMLISYGSWAYVYVEGLYGYMQLQYLSAAAPAQAPATAVPVPTATPSTGSAGYANTAVVRQPRNSFVYLRSSQNSNGTGNVLAQIPSGSTVTVIQYGKFWSKIIYNGITGYIVSQYLK